MRQNGFSMQIVPISRWPGLRRGAGYLSLLAVIAGSLACASFTPYHEVVAAHEANLVEIEGRRVYVEERGSGEPMVLLHGFGSSSFSWRHVASSLASSYRVVTLDFHGFGWTERPTGLEHYTRVGQMRLVERVMDHLEIESAHLVGHSYGGAIASSLAAERPDRVRSLVLVDAVKPTISSRRRYTAAEWPGVAWIITRSLLTRRVVTDHLFESIVDDSVVTPELIASYLARLRVQGAARAFRGLTEPLGGKEPPTPALGEIRTSTLVLWGEEDQTLDVDYGRSLAGELPDARFVVIPEAGHLVMEDRPDDVIRAIREFVDEAGPAATPAASR